MEALTDNGFIADQHFAISDESYRGARGAVARIALRARMYVEFPLRLLWDCLRRRGSNIRVVCTNPFFAPFIAVCFAGRRGKLVHLVYDLYPDALIVAGVRDRDTLLARYTHRVVAAAFRGAAANVFLGRRLQQYAESQFGSMGVARAIPVGAPSTTFADSPPRRIAPSLPVDILYCGNLGAMHDVQTLAEYVQRTSHQETIEPLVTVTFLASGPLYAILRDAVSRVYHLPPSWIQFGDPLEDAAWVERMKRAHVGLVTMKTGAETVVMPSKAYSALCAGQAILAVCPPDSDLADLIEEYDCGWVVTPGDVHGLQNVLRAISADRDGLHRKRTNAFRVGQGEFAESSIAKRWVTLLTELR